MNEANGLTDANAAKVAFTGVTRTSGTETFKKPQNNVALMIAGSFHGVSGTYSCTPADGATSCSATVATNGKGFTLAAADTWTFKPDSAAARVTDAPDSAYASYGWWLHKPASGDWVASVFTDNKGAAPTPIADMSGLNGTATYVGGAAGKYALSSTTGGMNDAGHFTARATLEADFAGDTDGGTISGTIDMFMGADGESRGWMVELKETDISSAGVIDGTDADTAPVGTVWTIGEKAAKTSGEWSGALQELGTDGVPKVATGTFDAWYGTAGRMVGAFGANKQ